MARGAVILAGGRSTRFGERDKATAPLGDQPLVRHVLERVAPVVDAVTINCRAAQQAAIADAIGPWRSSVQFATDPEEDRGPVMGIAVGLAATETDHCAVVACDMPFVDPLLLRYLFVAIGDADAILPRPDAWYVPTQAVYNREGVLESMQTVADAGDERILAALADRDVITVDAPVLDRLDAHASLQNINTQSELAAAADALGQ
jgi:Molybdopterin-guanine dinucleotide biosynthesis protein A